MTVSGQIIEVLNTLCEKFGLVMDWSNANVLPYLQELMTKFIKWEITTSWVWIIIGVVFLLFGIFLIVYEICSGYMCDGLGIVIGTILTVICVVVISCQVFDIVEAICLPEKTIYEFIKYQMSLH